MLDESLKWFLKQKIGREFRIEKILEATPKEKNLQSFHTPYDLCEKMISKTDVKGKSILVLFNIEFVKVLIEKFGVHSSNITFLADCRLESEMTTKTFHVNNIVVHNIEDIQEALKNMGKTFDLCFSNPPYGKSIEHTHLTILLEILPVCKEIIYIHSASWLMDNKNSSKSVFTKCKEKIKEYYKEADIFDGNKKFKIVGPCCPFVISVLDKNHKLNKSKVNYFGEEYEADTINDITIFGNNWKRLIKPFVDILLKHPNIWNHPRRISTTLAKKPPKNKFYFQCRSQVPGTSGADVYDCLIQLRSENKRYMVDYNDLTGQSRIKFYFDSETELINFIEFLKTDFVRFCINIYKNNENFHGGELKLVPWMDFTQSWTDEKLYKFFNIPQETIDYITNFFPDDIYGLRNKS